jgi:hypothetical protein
MVLGSPLLSIVFLSRQSWGKVKRKIQYDVIWGTRTTI